MSERSTLVRFPKSIDPRLDVLLELLQADPRLQDQRWSKAAVLRKAILEGLHALETEYGIAEPSKRR